MDLVCQWKSETSCSTSFRKVWIHCIKAQGTWGSTWVDALLSVLLDLSPHERIGLAVCRKLIDIMGGDIILDDTYDSGIEGCPGAGFAIYTNRSPVTLDDDDQHGHDRNDCGDDNADTIIVEPSKEDSSSNVLPAVVREELPEVCSVLFVDDDTLLRRLFTRSLSKVKPNWRLQEASNGETAIELATSNGPYDIIFMDYYMPSPTKTLLGTETVRAMRARGVKSLICGLSANDMKESFKDAGAETFMLKPFPCKPVQLLEALQQIWACRSLCLSKTGHESIPEYSERTATVSELPDDEDHISERVSI